MQRFDFLVIGSGIAGLFFALKVADRAKVAVICKKSIRDANTRYAQGGIATVMGPGDCIESHVRDTMDAGAGLCHEEIVKLVCSAGPDRIAQLVAWGTTFDRDEMAGTYKLGREGGHSERRILHSGDTTGAEIHESLLQQILKHPNISIFENHVAIDLIVRDGMRGRPEVCGAYVLSEDSGNVESFAGKFTIICTGGVGKVYLYTSNSDVATGDGIAMAFRAGAKAVNMEFIQFHPTCLFHPQAKSFLITEAMRGEGAKLLNHAGERFMTRYHPNAELAPRDIVARAIDAEMKRTGADCVYLDISFKEPDFVMSRFPMIYRTTREFGLDITKGPIPVVPAAHYCCGGIEVDSKARSSIDRLYVVGESAFTGLHGSNRLASNSLLEAAVFAHEAAEDALVRFPDLPTIGEVPEWNHLDTKESPELVLISHLWDEVRRTMWNLVGIVRSDKRLALAARRLRTFREDVLDYYWHFRVTSDLVELRNLVLVAEVIVKSAQLRRESRGLHYNIDCPERDDTNWLKNTSVGFSELAQETNLRAPQ